MVNCHTHFAGTAQIVVDACTRTIERMVESEQPLPGCYSLERYFIVNGAACIKIAACFADNNILQVTINLGVCHRVTKVMATPSEPPT